MRPPLNEEISYFRVIDKGLCEFYGINGYQLFEHTRKRSIVFKRHIFMKLAREIKIIDVPYGVIGAYCSEYYNIKAYDHATVMHACKAVQDIIDSDKSFRKEYNLLYDLIRAKCEANNAFVKAKLELIDKIISAKNPEEVEIILDSKKVKEFFCAFNDIKV